MKLLKRLIPFAIIISFAVGSLVYSIADTHAKDVNKAKIKNVIFLIGDGMGQAYITALRYYNDNPSTSKMEKTAFDPYFVGMQKTYSLDPDENVTDSAAAATALASGNKTYNGAIGVNMNKEPVETVLELAKKEGRSTGLVSTAQINHATPAAFAAHTESRHNYNEIADNYFDERINGKHIVDVMLGGGTSYFDRNDRHLIQEFENDGYSYVQDKDQLLADHHSKVLGLFAPKELAKAIDRNEDVPSLPEMTKAALERLSQDKKGFFLMVEGSEIDWAGHDNDVVAAMSELTEFEKTFKTALAFAKKDKHTLLVVTADHSTGGLSLGSDGIYAWNPAVIKAAIKTPDFMAQQIANGANVEETLAKYIDLKLTYQEIQSVKAATRKGQTAVDDAIENIFDKRSHTGWTTGGHTGVDVPIFAYGPSAQKFRGEIENTKIGKLLLNIMSK